ncbi:MAG: endonuclease domain-containing protein [Xanthomonadales bacterium]|nr:endonuclease domain-containing protein [Xanthomonadales bacterium]
MNNPPLPTRTRDHARSLRTDMTDAERKLWQRLRGGQVEGFKFRRQHPIPPYIVDFCCIAAKVVVELDGSQHEAGVDAYRTRYLQAQGYTVMRFWDNDVLNQTDAVIESIFNVANSRTLTPTPLTAGEGLQER